MWHFKKKEQKENNELKSILSILQKREETEIRLSVRALVMYESLSGKPFSSVKNNQEDMLRLMYCAFVCSTGFEISLGAFQEMLEDGKFANRLGGDLKRLQSFSEQFNNNEQSGNTEQGNAEISITEMVDKLIFEYHINAEYVLEKMQLWELNHFMKGAEDRYKDRMEEQRMWTYLQVAPQIDLKKCNSPEKLLPFPWSKEENKKRKEKELAAEATRAKATIGMKLNLNHQKEEGNG